MDFLSTRIFTIKVFYKLWVQVRVSGWDLNHFDFIYFNLWFVQGEKCFNFVPKTFWVFFLFIFLFSESSSKGFSFKALIKKSSPSKQNKVSYLKSKFTVTLPKRNCRKLFYFFITQNKFFIFKCSSKNSLCVILCEISMKTNCSDYKGELWTVDVRIVSWCPSWSNVVSW